MKKHKKSLVPNRITVLKKQINTARHVAAAYAAHNAAISQDTAELNQARTQVANLKLVVQDLRDFIETHGLGDAYANHLEKALQEQHERAMMADAE